MFGVHGGLFNVSGLQIWGGDLSEAYLYNLQTVTGIETDPGIRLWELWYLQKFGDKFAIKIGEQSLDQEFMISPNASYFINAMFGWPILPTADLPGGGPAYPLASLGVRARVTVTDTVDVVAGLFNGSPIPENSPNTPKSNPYGVSFPLNTGVLAIAELHFRFPGSGASAQANEDHSLPGTQIGAWYDSYRFDDQQYDNMGVPLASPASNGIPADHHGDFSIYALADQMIWRSKDDPDRNLNVFIRPMFTPLQDRNLISFSVDAGLTMHGLFPGARRRHFRPWHGRRAGQQRRVRLRQATAVLPALRLYARAELRDICRGDLSGSGQALVANSAGGSVHYKSRRRDRQSERSNAEDQERTGDRPAHERHVLTALGRSGQSEGGAKSVQRLAEGAACAAVTETRRGAGLRRKSATTTNAAPAAAT